ncbi:hypothetical protein J8273_3846 [Carpediemonas membranifera]|uniref:Uncharacterized protein n=1 Tax=Carpediemonas membranifera TaxID=201153 RepID=A0A8J6B7X9_9EUKA|nr:hypothetical protein J8273_3846 [Carpediemonas membranifera]|eukprot:KAG9394592.1 hypothetical protein J8273_3846 [Carpediemonas membranifera]
MTEELGSHGIKSWSGLTDDPRRIYDVKMPQLSNITRKVLLYDEFMKGITPHTDKAGGKLAIAIGTDDFGDALEPCQLNPSLQERYIELFKTISNQIAARELNAILQTYDINEERTLSDGLEVRATVELRRRLRHRLDHKYIMRKAMERLRFECTEQETPVQTAADSDAMLLLAGERETAFPFDMQP